MGKEKNFSVHETSLAIAARLKSTTMSSPGRQTNVSWSQSIRNETYTGPGRSAGSASAEAIDWATPSAISLFVDKI